MHALITVQALDFCHINFQQACIIWSANFLDWYMYDKSATESLWIALGLVDERQSKAAARPLGSVLVTNVSVRSSL